MGVIIASSLTSAHVSQMNPEADPDGVGGHDPSGKSQVAIGCHNPYRPIDI